MVQTFAENDNNDLYIGGDGNLAILSGVAAIAQNCTDIMEAQLGEMPLATQRGVPTMATIWQAWLPKQFEVQARAMLLTINGVTGITGFTITRANGVATYVVTLTTIYDPITVSGSLSQ